MKVKQYKTTACGAFIGSGIFVTYYGYIAYSENNFWIFLLGLLVAIPTGIYFGNETIKSIKKRIVADKIIFKKEETLKYLVYALIIGNTLLVGLFIGFVLFLHDKQQNLIGDILEKLFYFSYIFSGFWTGILFIISLFQYMWVYLWEKKTKIKLIEENE